MSFAAGNESAIRCALTRDSLQNEKGRPLERVDAGDIHHDAIDAAGAQSSRDRRVDYLQSQRAKVMDDAERRIKIINLSLLSLCALPAAAADFFRVRVEM